MCKENGGAKIVTIDSIAVNQFNLIIKDGVDSSDMSAVLEEALKRGYQELLSFVKDSITNFVKLKLEAERRLI